MTGTTTNPRTANRYRAQEPSHRPRRDPRGAGAGDRMKRTDHSSSMREARSLLWDQILVATHAPSQRCPTEHPTTRRRPQKEEGPGRTRRNTDKPARREACKTTAGRTGRRDPGTGKRGREPSNRIPQTEACPEGANAPAAKNPSEQRDASITIRQRRARATCREYPTDDPPKSIIGHGRRDGAGGGWPWSATPHDAWLLSSALPPRNDAHP